MKNQLKGCIKFSVKGKNLYKFINRLRDEHLNCSNQYCKNDIYYGEVCNSDFKIVQEIAEIYNMEIDSFEYETIRKKIYRYRHRYGIFAGIIIIFISIVYFSNIVMTIEINGNSKISDTVILSMLEDIGIEKGTQINNIDFSSCERKMRIRNEDISWIGIRHSGNRLIVELTEVIPAPEMLDERIPCNILADKTATITDISVYNGQLMRIIGDPVKSGDIIVNGVVKDAKNHIILHHSHAKIIGIYEDSVNFHQDYQCSIKEFSGKTRNEKYLNLFNIKIPLFLGKNKFELYSTDSSSSNINFINTVLPISFTKNKISEQIITQKIYSEDEAKAIIEEKIFIYEKNFLSDVKIVERDINYSSDGNGLDCQVTYTIEGEIGIKKEIYLK